MAPCCDNTGAPRRTGWQALLTSRIAIVTGVAFVTAGGLAVGGWGWLVAAGLAPILLSVLPCLVMCGLGLCMMGMSNKSKSNTASAIGAAVQNGDGTFRRGDSMPSTAIRPNATRGDII